MAKRIRGMTQQLSFKQAEYLLKFQIRINEYLKRDNSKFVNTWDGNWDIEETYKFIEKILKQDAYTISGVESEQKQLNDLESLYIELKQK